MTIVCEKTVQAGNVLTVCYEDFPPGASEVTLKVRIEDDNGGDDEVDMVIDPDHRCFTVRIPEDAVEVVISDKTFQTMPQVVEVVD